MELHKYHYPMVIEQHLGSNNLNDLRHLLRQHVGQDVDGVSFGFGGWSCSQEQLQKSNLT